MQNCPLFNQASRHEDVWGSRELHTFLTAVLDGCEYFTLRPLCSRGKSSRCSLDWWLGGHWGRSGSDGGKEKSLLLVGIKPWSSCPDQLLIWNIAVSKESLSISSHFWVVNLLFFVLLGGYFFTHSSFEDFSSASFVTYWVTVRGGGRGVRSFAGREGSWYQTKLLAGEAVRVKRQTALRRRGWRVCLLDVSHFVGSFLVRGVLQTVSSPSRSSPAKLKKHEGDRASTSRPVRQSNRS